MIEFAFVKAVIKMRNAECGMTRYRPPFSLLLMPAGMDAYSDNNWASASCKSRAQ